MSHQVVLSEDQSDCLQELSNVAMGKAGDAVARLLNKFVKLSIPRIDSLSKAEQKQRLGEQLAAGGDQVYHREFVFADDAEMTGDVLTVLKSLDMKRLALSEGGENNISEAKVLKRQQDIVEVMNGAYLQEFGKTMQQSINLEPLTELDTTSSLPPFGREGNDSPLLTVTVNFKLDVLSLDCDMVLLLPAKAQGLLVGRIDDYLAH